MPLIPTATGSGGAVTTTIPVATTAEVSSKLSLVVSPRFAPAATWIRPTQVAGAGFAGMFLLIYLAGLVRARSVRAD